MKGAQWMDIRSDRQKGLSYVELGRKYHMDPRTAKRYAESPQKPEYTLSEPKPTKMEPYKQNVDEWLEEAPYSAQRILEKLREMGFDGGYSIVKAYVSSRKMDLNEKAKLGLFFVICRNWRFRPSMMLVVYMIFRISGGYS